MIANTARSNSEMEDNKMSEETKNEKVKEKRSAEDILEIIIAVFL